MRISASEMLISTVTLADSGPVLPHERLDGCAELALVHRLRDTPHGPTDERRCLISSGIFGRTDRFLMGREQIDLDCPTEQRYCQVESSRTV